MSAGLSPRIWARVLILGAGRVGLAGDQTYILCWCSRVRRDKEGWQVLFLDCVHELICHGFPTLFTFRFPLEAGKEGPSLGSPESGVRLGEESFSCVLCFRDFIRGCPQWRGTGWWAARRKLVLGSAPTLLPRSLWVLHFFSGKWPLPHPIAICLLTNASVPQPKSLLPLAGEVVGLGQGGGSSSGRRLECLSGVGGARWGPYLLTSLQVLGRQIWGAHSLKCLSQHCLLSS